MVGFGSSLRLSRRRGWEDAYLDYQSLRLLLTQIEAVYEEEDWTRRDDDGGNAATGGAMDDMDEGGEAHASDGEEEGEGGWKTAWRSARRKWHCFANVGTNKRRTRRYPRLVDDEGAPRNSALGLGGWVSNEYLDSPEHQRRKRDKDKGAAALDRGGWRSPGATDYRDELFLVSDEEAAYGIDEVGNTDEEEWEDEDEEDGIGDAEGRYYDNSEVGKYDGAVESSGDRPSRLFDGQDGLAIENTLDPKKITPGSEALSMVEEAGNEEPYTRECHSPELQEKTNAANNRLLHTPNSKSSEVDPSYLPAKLSSSERGHRVQFSDSPGVLEAGYETFATAAARRGMIGPGGHHDPLPDGSPSEQGGWFGFLPNLLSKGKQPPNKDRTSSELNPLLLKQRDVSDRSGSLTNSLLDHSPVGGAYDEAHVGSMEDSPHRYTHFAEKFSTLRSPSESIGMAPPRPPQLEEGVDKMIDGAMARAGLKLPYPIATPVLSESKTLDPSVPPVQAAALGTMLPTTPMTPMTPPLSPQPPSRMETDNRIGGFGVSLKMIPTESSELLRPSSPRKTPSQHADAGMSQFYSFKNDDAFGSNPNDRTGGYPEFGSHVDQRREYDGGDEEDNRARSNSNMISFYSGEEEGYFSVRSPTKKAGMRPGSRHHREWPPEADAPQSHLRMPSLSSVRESFGDGGGNFVLGLLFGDVHPRGKNPARKGPGGASQSRPTMVRSMSNEHVAMQRRNEMRQKRAARRRRARLRRERQLRRRRERVPEHLRVAHARAAAITERFRGLLRAEVEKVILFANSRLGELADTMGSLRYSSYEDGELGKEYPSLADGGMHIASSSEDGDSGTASVSSDEFGLDDDLDGAEDHRIFKSDSSNDETKKQIMLRDRLRISRPMFQKADDILGEDFSLLSAVDEADAYTAVGVELMHLLKYVMVNIIAVRKISRKHDRLLSNRMLGGYYQRLAAETRKSHGEKRGRQHHLIQMNDVQPQFGETLSNSTASAGYILGIYDKKIQHIANSTTMQTVSSSLAVALDEVEASQSRSTLLGLGFGPKSKRTGSGKFETGQEQVSSPSLKTSRLRDVVAYQISGQCFRGDSDSSAASSQENQDLENASSTEDMYSTMKLKFVVTSIFGLREAARSKSSMFEHYSSRLLMISAGPNVAGDGLDGCSRDTLDFLCSYNPDAAYTLDQSTLSSALGRGKDGIGGVMVASLAAAAKGYDLESNRSRYQRYVAATMSINPQSGEDNGPPSFRSAEYQNVLALNAASLVLYLANYYIMVPTAHIHSASLGSQSSAAALVGITNVSFILSTCIHSIVMSKRNSFVRKPSSYLRKHPGYFRIPLMICSAFGVAGNILQSVALSKSSLGMGLAGRFLIGLSSAQAINLHLLRVMLPSQTVNREAAHLARLSLMTIPFAFVFGSLFDIKVKDKTMLPQLREAVLSTMPSPTPASNAPLVSSPGGQPFLPPLPLEPRGPAFVPFGQHSLFSLESMGYILAVAWFMHLVAMIFFFDLPKRKRNGARDALYQELRVPKTEEEDFDSDADTRDHEKQQAYQSTEDTGTFEKLQTMSRKTVKHQAQHTYRESIANARRLMFSNVAFPTTVAVLFIGRTMSEVLTSSGGTILSRYFNWSGARSGLFMGFLACTILPIHKNLSSERNYAERSIMKVALGIARYGLVLMINYESLFFFFMSIVNSSLKKGSRYYYYDGMVGILQYLLSFAIVFCSVTTLEGATLSLMSKAQIAPRQMKKYAIDSAFTVIVVSALGRLAGDALIYAFDVSSWTLFNDIVNSLCLTMIVALTAGIYVVRKHFFFLI